MKTLLVIAFALISTTAFADSNLSDCQTVLMSEPNCVNLVNASNFCNMMGNTKEAAQSASACITQMSAGKKPTTDILAMCLAGYVTSSSPSDNQTLCK